MRNFLTVALAIIALAGCNNSSLNTQKQPPVSYRSGALSGPIISGIDYSSCDSLGCKHTGVTNEKGQFSVAEGHLLVFSFGSTKIFEGSDQATGRILDFSVLPNELDMVFLNKMSLLYTINELESPEEGIQLSDVARRLLKDRRIDFNRSTEKFAADPKIAELVSAITMTQMKGEQPLLSISAVKRLLAQSQIAAGERQRLAALKADESL